MKTDSTARAEVLSALRFATAGRHRIVDDAMPLSVANPRLPDYFEHLRIMRRWLRPMERWFESFDATATGSSPYLKQIPWIEADLASAGAEPPDPAERESEWPMNANASYRWGARYVIEGSRLGAAALYRRLRHSLYPHELEFLRGGAAPVISRWPAFLCEMRSAVRTELQIAEACRGACASFDALLALCPASPAPA